MTMVIPIYTVLPYCVILYTKSWNITIMTNTNNCAQLLGCVEVNMTRPYSLVTVSDSFMMEAVARCATI